MFCHLDDEQLMAELAEYRSALKKGLVGGSIRRVSGENRSMTVMGVSVDGCMDMIRALEAEAAARGLLNCGGRGGAIPVEIG